MSGLSTEYIMAAANVTREQLAAAVLADTVALDLVIESAKSEALAQALDAHRKRIEGDIVEVWPIDGLTEIVVHVEGLAPGAIQKGAVVVEVTR